MNTLIATVGEDGSESSEIYDDLGRKIQSGIKNITGSFSYVNYLYDIYDRKIKASEPNNTSQWSETKFDEYGSQMRGRYNLWCKRGSCDLGLIFSRPFLPELTALKSVPV